MESQRDPRSDPRMRIGLCVPVPGREDIEAAVRRSVRTESAGFATAWTDPLLAGSTAIPKPPG
jgi:hypothetical protein